MARGKLLLACGEHIALRPFIEGAMFEEPFPVSLESFDFATLSKMLEFIRLKVNVLCRLLESENFACHRN
jgi:hypothetical protein